MPRRKKTKTRVVDTSKVVTTYAGTPPPETVFTEFPSTGWVMRWQGDDGCIYQRRDSLTVYVSVIQVLGPEGLTDEPLERWLQIQCHHKSRVLERRELYDLKEFFFGKGSRAVELYEEGLPSASAAQLWKRLDGPTVVPEMPDPDTLKELRSS